MEQNAANKILEKSEIFGRWNRCMNFGNLGLLVRYERICYRRSFSAGWKHETLFSIQNVKSWVVSLKQREHTAAPERAMSCYVFISHCKGTRTCYNLYLFTPLPLLQTQIHPATKQKTHLNWIEDLKSTFYDFLWGPILWINFWPSETTTRSLSQLR